MSILINNAWILTQNKKHEQFIGNIYIEDQNISQISKKNISVEADYKIDGKNKLVMPGLINTHTHIPMTLLRGYADDMILQQWLENKIWPVEAKLDNKSIEIGTKLGILEMISSGTTTFLDMYFFEDTISKTCEKAGIRAFPGFAFIDFGTPEYSYNQLFSECEKFIKKWQKNSLINPVLAPHAIYTCGPESLKKILTLSEKYNTLIHLHCSETRENVYEVQKKYGIRPVELLKKYDILSEKTSLAHCGWITKNEIQILKKTNASICHCPVSNM